MDLAPIQTAVTHVMRVTPGVVSAYLFGSVAEGRAHRQSDLDLAVLLDWTNHPTSAERFETRIRLVAGLGSALGRNDVDLVVLNDVPPTFARAILDRGRQLFISDAARDHAFHRDTMLRAADLEPFLRRMRRLTLEASTR